jgi:8-hydroxy-5-deazaflavin:NADPH oxidoreductase
MSDGPNLPTIAVLGGTGKEGKGLAYRWARAGYPVIIGSRSAEKAAQAANELLGMLGGSPSLGGLANGEAAARADIVVLTVPYAAHAATLESVKAALAGKILIDVAVPLVPPKVTKVQMPAAGSAAQEARSILGEGSEVAAAFHTIPHEALLRNEAVDCEVLVTGTSKETRRRALELVSGAGLVGWDAGPIENSVVAEGLTSVLININKQYGSTHAGIRITGVPGK